VREVAEEVVAAGAAVEAAMHNQLAGI